MWSTDCAAWHWDPLVNIYHQCFYNLKLWNCFNSDGRLLASVNLVRHTMNFVLLRSDGTIWQQIRERERTEETECQRRETPPGLWLPMCFITTSRCHATEGHQPLPTLRGKEIILPEHAHWVTSQPLQELRASYFHLPIQTSSDRIIVWYSKHVKANSTCPFPPSKEGQERAIEWRPLPIPGSSTLCPPSSPSNQTVTTNWKCKGWKPHCARSSPETLKLVKHLV